MLRVQGEDRGGIVIWFKNMLTHLVQAQTPEKKTVGKNCPFREISFSWKGRGRIGGGYYEKEGEGTMKKREGVKREKRR